MSNRIDSSILLYEKITSEGVTSYKITNAWGDVVEGKQ
jgi:hypothetical protein